MSETYSYNNLGELAGLQKVIGGTTYPLSYAYNLAGELTSITYPSGRVVQQSFDTIGRFSQITSSSVNYLTVPSSNGYNAAGEILSATYGNGVTATFGYTPDRLLLQSLAYTKGATTLFSTNYWYKTDSTNCPSGAAGNNGQIQCITDNVDPGRTVSYAYDALYRLASATTNGSASYVKWGLTWGYDRYGNVLAENQAYDTPPHFSVSVDATTNRLTGSPYAYDANGNMTNDGNNTLVYDAENRVLSATNGSASGTYTYDGNNLRVKKVSGGTTTVYIFSGTKVIAEYVGGAAPASPTREYIYSGSALLAKIDSSGTKYYHQDRLSNRLVTDSSGNTVAQLGHYPFGESWYNASSEKWLFTSYERDSESGNDYALMRSYVNRLARFSSPDLLSGSLGDPQSLNHYSYALNDPANLIDPTGLFISNAPPDPIWGPPGGPDFGGGGGAGGFGCFYSGDDFQNENTYFPTFSPSGCIYLGPLQRGGGHGGGGGGPDFAKLKEQAVHALMNPNCSALFGGFQNAVTSLFNSSYNMYTPNEANPYPNQISAALWTTAVVKPFQNPDTFGRTVWVGPQPGAFLFFGNNFSTYDPGFAPTPGGFTQMTGFLHEMEHAANHIGSQLDVNYAGDFAKINTNCTPKQIETQSVPITGELTAP